MMQINMATILIQKDFSQYIYKYMVLEIPSIKYFEQCILLIGRDRLLAAVNISVEDCEEDSVLQFLSDYDLTVIVVQCEVSANNGLNDIGVVNTGKYFSISYTPGSHSMTLF